MNTHQTLTTVRPPATVAMILGTPDYRPAKQPKRASEPAQPTHCDPQALQSDLVKFREDIRRRYETPFRTSWPNDGVNELADLKPCARPGYQILVVDDEPGVCKAIKLLLEFDGHQVQTVTSGEAALSLFEQRPFDLIITDYSMWGMKGDQLAARLKQRRPHQAIIMATSSADEFNLWGKSSGGADCVLKKPFSRKDLRDAMARILR